MEHIDHILVVDDDRDIRELIVDYLVKSGYHASGAANGKEMRVLLDKQHIDLVVLDVMMPGDDGLTLCRQLRSSRHKDLPILMLTARNEDTDRILGLEMGADDYVVKPFVARELLARIYRSDPAHAACRQLVTRGASSSAVTCRALLLDCRTPGCPAFPAIHACG